MPAEFTEDTHAKFVFQSDVPGSTYMCWLDGVLDETCTSPMEFDLPFGEHFFAVLAQDRTGSGKSSGPSTSGGSAT